MLCISAWQAAPTTENRTPLCIAYKFVQSCLMLRNQSLLYAKKTINVPLDVPQANHS